MKFEEELKNQCYCHMHHVCHWCYILRYTEELKDVINKFYINKQLVKEAINKAGEYPNDVHTCEIVGLIRRELGLEE